MAKILEQTGKEYELTLGVADVLGWIISETCIVDKHSFSAL